MPPIPANIIPALFAAAFWGMGDFSGGMSVKSAPPSANPLGAALRVVLFSHLTSFTVLLALVFALHQPIPRGAPLAWGIGAGILAGSSLAAFYMALSRGAMGASAAISGLLAAAIPSIIEILLEGSPGPHRLLGFLVAGIAIWLIAAGPAHSTAGLSKKQARSTLLLALFAGIGFGLYFAALKFAGIHSTPLCTMASARIGSIATCALTLLYFKLRTPPNQPSPAKMPVTLSEANSQPPAKMPVTLSEANSQPPAKMPVILSEAKDQQPAKMPVILSEAKDQQPAKMPVILSEAKDPCISPFVSPTTPTTPTTPATPLQIPRTMILWILSTALFDTSGNLLFVVATRAGRLDIASVLASLYPAGTILLASAILAERPTRRQLTGMAIAAAAVLLITL
jgi:drug/metabolite transporter (DMT)-like permease